MHWNRVHNLTAIDRPADVLTHHLLDSLAAAPSLRALAGDRPLRVLDVGSGGGMPGIPLAIALPDVRFTLLDKVGKKIAFLVHATATLGIENVDAVHARVEAFRAGLFDVIIARAFASLSEFVRLTRHLIAPGGHWVALKATMPTEEIDALQRAQLGVRISSTVKLRVPRLNAERHLLLIEPS
jgi:16S rRNA (guanine527-N7)-methyltransferase